MRSRILVMILLAVVCGGVSLVLARSWLDGEADARRRAIEAEAVVPQVDFATMVVASEPLRFGTVLAGTNLKTIPWPNEALPEGAFSTVDQLLAGEPRTVLFPLENGEPILTAKITGPGERAGLSRLIAEGHRAVAIRVNDVAGVAGFILPGDRVDVVLTAQTGEVVASDVILQGVRVLSIDQTADERTEEPTVVKAVTVEVDSEGAQKIALAQSVGTISLMLRRSGEDATTEVSTITAEDLAGRAAQVELPTLPVAPSPAVEPEPPKEAAAPAKALVGVTRALERTEYAVPSRGEPEARAGNAAPANGPVKEAALR